MVGQLCLFQMDNAHSPAWIGAITGVATAHPYLHLESRRHDSRLCAHFQHQESAISIKRGGVWGIAIGYITLPAKGSTASVRWALEEITIDGMKRCCAFFPLSAVWYLPQTVQVSKLQTSSRPTTVYCYRLCTFLIYFNPIATAQASSSCLSSSRSSCISSPWKRPSSEPKKETCHFSLNPHCV